jgi:hypothetical protein
MSLCALALHPWARAADLQSWNSVDFGVFTNKRVRWWGTASIRLRDHVHRGYFCRQVNPDHAFLRPTPRHGPA